MAGVDRVIALRVADQDCLGATGHIMQSNLDWFEIYIGGRGPG